MHKKNNSEAHARSHREGRRARETERKRESLKGEPPTW